MDPRIDSNKSSQRSYEERHDSNTKPPNKIREFEANNQPSWDGLLLKESLSYPETYIIQMW
jgi:hypothetical protein